MKFKVGDKVKAKVQGQELVGVIKEINHDVKYLCYFDSWFGGHNGNDACRGNYKGNHCWYLDERDLEFVERGENIMRKSDLENGAIVEIRNGDKYILLFNCCKYGNKEDLFISLNNGGYLNFSNYNENLNDCDDKDYDIMKVCQNAYVGNNIRSHVLKQGEDDWTWVREEETVMTISEIEKKLGISNLKIKKED